MCPYAPHGVSTPAETASPPPPPLPPIVSQVSHKTSTTLSHSLGGWGEGEDELQKWVEKIKRERTWGSERMGKKDERERN